ncbi:ketopantoate reductase family protein [Planococcus lenghuensis]|uniref:2-dehydropantoate 2-reductase n=1 Tax=Planococcus lenghuensis TaxID=2213202 RepID=A0A1Q2KUX7_9BACL|nr:ketopantoate reductase family protein [Planococcus lenghuensis]AQQ51989.1 2-dehydropantoate 2-reductase [Planococcus lenghuensis]
MKILVVGAGAVGGYFGGRLLEKGEDVTFLVRESRKRKLEENGFNIRSVHGDFNANPKLLVSGEREEKFDVAILSVKAYQLVRAIEDLRPHLAEDGIVLPLLNGISHIDELARTFGKERVIGGLCLIESTLDNDGTILQKSPMHQIVYGELSGEKTERIKRLEASFSGTKASFELSDHIEREMWHKYLFITAMSGITSLFEAPIGPIRDLDSGQRAIKALLNEITAIMQAVDAPIREDIADVLFERINGLGHAMKSSMQRDVEKGAPTEADHLQGYLLKQAHAQGIEAPLLETIHTKLTLYQQARIAEW